MELTTELTIQAQTAACFVTQRPFEEGQRVVSVLLRLPSTGDVVRRDMLESATGDFVADGALMCRWVRAYKPRKAGENPERELKLTAENLFMTLVDPLTELTPDSERLVMFLALMLERKRVLRPKGRTADGAKNVYEHAKTKQIIEVPGGELTPEFFVQVRDQLGVLVGTGERSQKSGDRSQEEAGGNQEAADENQDSVSAQK